MELYFPGGTAVYSHSSVASAPLLPERELKQRQKSSRLKAEPFVVQAAILKNILKVRFIIWEKKYYLGAVEIPACT